MHGKSNLARRGGHGEDAFTLIELLIVVAIIAILAAIAVPNFIEAQVRAKVSRCKSDMRSLGVAMEAYAVDNVGYYLDSKKWYTNLTTPVAYITAVPEDTFGEATYMGDPRINEVMYPGAVALAGIGNVTGDELGNTWMFESHGPSKTDDTSGSRENLGYSLTTSNYPWTGLDNAPNAPAAVVGIIYDSTNGTRSRGNIFRAGGMVPGPTAAHGIWFNAVSQ